MMIGTELRAASTNSSRLTPRLLVSGLLTEVTVLSPRTVVYGSALEPRGALAAAIGTIRTINSNSFVIGPHLAEVNVSLDSAHIRFLADPPLIASATAWVLPDNTNARDALEIGHPRTNNFTHFRSAGVGAHSSLADSSEAEVV